VSTSLEPTRRLRQAHAALLGSTALLACTDPRFDTAAADVDLHAIHARCGFVDLI
jgi:hypothetical protein